MRNVPRSAGAGQPDGDGRSARFRLVGRDVRIMFALSAAVCSWFAIPALLELLRMLSASDAKGGETNNVGVLTVAVLFFGLPALASAVAAIRPPRGNIVVDAKGVRVDDVKHPFGVEWWQTRAVAVSISWPNRFAARTAWRRRFHRRIHILFAPADTAQELPPNLLAWPYHPDFTHALAIPSAPLTGDDPPIVRGLVKAMQAAAPEKFVGVLRSTR